ncbi:hypothetical protein ACRAWD_11550 [Caulobacter segnis]
MKRVVAAMEFELTDKVGKAADTPSPASWCAQRRCRLFHPSRPGRDRHLRRHGESTAGSPPRAEPTDAQARKVRQALVEAMNNEGAGRPLSPFVTGYAAAYRIELARVIWTAISDAPARRLQNWRATRLV